MYEYETYDAIYKKAKYVGSALKNLHLLAEIQEGPGKPIMNVVGIYAKNRAEWTICDMANAMYGYAMIPLYDTLGPESVSFVLGHSEIITCICSGQSMDVLVKTNNLHKLRNIIALDDNYSKETAAGLKKKGINIISFYNLIIQGKSNKLSLPTTIQHSTVFTFSYTSGTTGNPKGAMITH